MRIRAVLFWNRFRKTGPARSQSDGSRYVYLGQSLQCIHDQSDDELSPALSLCGLFISLEQRQLANALTLQIFTNNWYAKKSSLSDRTPYNRQNWSENYDVRRQTTGKPKNDDNESTWIQMMAHYSIQYYPLSWISTFPLRTLWIAVIYVHRGSTIVARRLREQPDVLSDDIATQIRLTTTDCGAHSTIIRYFRLNTPPTGRQPSTGVLTRGLTGTGWTRYYVL